MSLKAFSQTDTVTATIQLTKPIAQLVVKDLIKLDGLSLELKTTKSLLFETNNKLSTQTELLSNLTSQVDNYQLLIDKKDKQIKTQQELSAELQREIKKIHLQKKIFQYGTVIAGTAVILTYLVE